MEGNTKTISEKKQVVKVTHFLDWLRTGSDVKVLL
jgi:hypothetical protein